MKAKKGISLIVLVITIIVIIILAGAVILNLTQNNPINSAKVAKIVQERESLESSISLYLSRVIASTSGDYTVAQILEGKAIKRPANSETSTPATYYDALVTTSTETVGTTTVNGFISNPSSVIDLNPSTASGTWYVDTATGKCYLVVSASDIPSWIEVEDGTTEIINKTLAEFVVIK